ncbi:hypothetical protein PTKIN_Ptkin04bG0052200 [Pterospermum kingtungense]
MAMSNIGAHILVYPFPASGHIIPFLDLTHRLLTRGLTVTVLLTPNNLHLLDPLLSLHVSSSLQPLVLPAPGPSSSTIPGPLGTMSGLREVHYPLLLQWFQSQASPPVAIFSDFFLGWTQSLASEVGVRRVVFSTSGSFAYSVKISMCQEPPRIDDPHDVNNTFSFPRVPNSQKYLPYQISSVYRFCKDGDPGKEYYRKNWFENLNSWGLVINTFVDLESIYIEHMKKEMGHDSVWAVGPVMPIEDDNVLGLDTTNRGGSSSVPCHELMTWLDAWEDNSVVYVCFGSHHVPTQKQTDELAQGLEQSGVSFVWCVREPKDRKVSADHGVVPEGFEDRVAGKGFIIKGWAPQVAILRHRAVGAFLTHCGWNSTLEGIAAGVVMVTWPMGADQFFNTELLVDQCGVGIRLGESTEKIPEASKVARVLVESLDGSRQERTRAKKLSETALSAVKGGSSYKDLDSLVKAVNELKAEKGRN